ncbi:MAG: hypothetical protein SGJ13_17660, partial [Actinomycetota bacterium]|nr:hypothetical protein [Actinomycetota bacterium]
MNIALSAMPKPARWRPQVRGLAILGALLAGPGAAVLMQQYGVAPLSFATLGLCLFAAFAVSIVVPSFAFAIAVVAGRLQQRRSLRTQMLGATVAVLIVATLVCVTATGAGAAVEGPCFATVNGNDLAELEPTKANAIEVTDPATLRVIVTGYGVIEDGSLNAHNPLRDVTVQQVSGKADLAPEPHILTFDFALENANWLGGGLHEFSAVANFEEAGSCTATFMVSADVAPMSTMPGKIAAAAVALGGLLVVLSSVGAARSLRVRTLNDLRRSFANLEAARSHTAAIGLPAGPAWAPRRAPGSRPAPLPGDRAHWWRDEPGTPAADDPFAASVPAADAPAVEPDLASPEPVAYGSSPYETVHYETVEAIADEPEPPLEIVPTQTYEPKYDFELEPFEIAQPEPVAVEEPQPEFAADIEPATETPWVPPTRDFELASESTSPFGLLPESEADLAAGAEASDDDAVAAPPGWYGSTYGYAPESGSDSESEREFALAAETETAAAAEADAAEPSVAEPARGWTGSVYGYAPEPVPEPEAEIGYEVTAEADSESELSWYERVRAARSPSTAPAEPELGAAEVEAEVDDVDVDVESTPSSSPERDTEPTAADQDVPEPAPWWADAEPVAAVAADEDASADASTEIETTPRADADTEPTAADH